MELSEQNLAQLRLLMHASLSPNGDERKAAEATILTFECQPGFPLLVLQMISNLSVANASREDVGLRQACSVLFKNIIKRRWAVPLPADDAGAVVLVADQDRDTIKTHLVELMCSTPQDVQRQLAEAVSIVSKYDFPAKWQGLLQQLVAKLATQDLNIAKGVMLTTNSIMKRFRYVFKTNDLMTELVFCLQGLQEPLLAFFQCNWNTILALSAAADGSNKQALESAMETHRLMTRIFFSLNWQDLPEYFEDHIGEWMAEFKKILEYSNPMLVNDDEEDEEGPIEKIQAAVVENVNLYVSKYEEEFLPHLSEFTQCIWGLLMQVGPKSKYDTLATSSIKFLTSVSSKQMNTPLFTDQVLQDIVQRIVVPNLMATQFDEELFEDNAQDYIRKDNEGSDTDTRRRSAMELIRSLLRFFGPKVSELSVGYIGAMLDEYARKRDWRAKDAALHLMLATAVLNQSSVSGAAAGELNPGIPLQELFGTHVLPEIADADVNANGIVKADALKIVCVFRQHLPAPMLLQLLPNIVRHLKSSSVVVQTYAAMCIEKFLLVKDKDTGTRVKKEHLSALTQDMFTGLFSVLENADGAEENDYVMKCVLRLLVVLGADVSGLAQAVLERLGAVLGRVCRNPINPHFNHYLFESLAVVVRSCCGGVSNEATEAACGLFESLLFPPFNFILQQDVQEFTPYVFQILAQLLSCRRVGALSEPYRLLFVVLLRPDVWLNKGNVPALSLLLRVYIRKGMADIVAMQSLEAVLGVFQKLLASKATEVEAFSLLRELVSSEAGVAALPQYLPQIIDMQLRRMQDQCKDTKTPRFARLFVGFLGLYSKVWGGAHLMNSLEGAQAGLTSMIITKVWAFNLEQCKAASKGEMKDMILGGTRLLCESGIKDLGVEWLCLVKNILFLTRAVGEAGGGGGEEEEEEEVVVAGDAAFSRLAYAQVGEEDEGGRVDVGVAFAQGLAGLCTSRPGQYGGALQGGLDEIEKASLGELCVRAGVALA